MTTANKYIQYTPRNIPEHVLAIVESIQIKEEDRYEWNRAIRAMDQLYEGHDCYSRLSKHLSNLDLMETFQEHLDIYSPIYEDVTSTLKRLTEGSRTPYNTLRIVFDRGIASNKENPSKNDKKNAMDRVMAFVEAAGKVELTESASGTNPDQIILDDIIGLYESSDFVLVAKDATKGKIAFLMDGTGQKYLKESSSYHKMNSMARTLAAKKLEESGTEVTKESIKSLSKSYLSQIKKLEESLIYEGKGERTDTSDSDEEVTVDESGERVVKKHRAHAVVAHKKEDENEE